MGILVLTADERVTDVKFTKDTLSVALKDGRPSSFLSPGIHVCSTRPQSNEKTGASQAGVTAFIGQTLTRI